MLKGLVTGSLNVALGLLLGVKLPAIAAGPDTVVVGLLGYGARILRGRSKVNRLPKNSARDFLRERPISSHAKLMSLLPSTQNMVERLEALLHRPVHVTEDGSVVTFWLMFKSMAGFFVLSKSPLRPNDSTRPSTSLTLIPLGNTSATIPRIVPTIMLRYTVRQSGEMRSEIHRDYGRVTAGHAVTALVDELSF